MRRAVLALAAAVAGWVVVAGPAQAHVEVLPAQLTVREAAELTFRVPNERDVATTRVQVTIPPEITVFSFGEPPAGWRVVPLRGPDDSFRTITWVGGTIPPERYADFTVLATPFTAGTAVWQVRQAYADGVVKPWTGPPEQPGEESRETGPSEPGPAAAQTILAEGVAAAATAPAAAAGGDDDSAAGVWLGVIAIGISLLAVLATGFLWSTRPARLPDDTDEEEGS